MRFVSKSVVIGFVNALAILIFMAQLPELLHMPTMVYVFVTLGLAIIYLFPYVPKIGKLLPSPLVCIVVITLLAVVFGVDIRTVGDMGQLPNQLPVFLIPQIPFNFDTLAIITPYAFAMAFVGLLESMMTATIIDEMTETTSNKHQECIGQGIANITTGFLGGMAGCAMIGQSMINIKSGGRGRLSTCFAGVFLLILVVFISDWLRVIPMAALVAVMIMVCIGTFNWQSVLNFHKNPKTSNMVMLATVTVVVATHNLALGVLTGVLLSAVFFIHKVEKTVNVTLTSQNNRHTYKITGPLFFSSAQKTNLTLHDHIKFFYLDLTDTYVWDITSIEVLDRFLEKAQALNISYEIQGLSQENIDFIKQYSRFIS